MLSFLVTCFTTQICTQLSHSGMNISPAFVAYVESYFYAENVHYFCLSVISWPK